MRVNAVGCPRNLFLGARITKLKIASPHLKEIYFCTVWSTEHSFRIFVGFDKHLTFDGPHGMSKKKINWHMIHNRHVMHC